MLKLLLLLIGVAGGAAGTISWLLSEPPGSNAALLSNQRVQEVRDRLSTALEQGKQAGAARENQMRQQLDAYRRNPNRSGAA